MGALFYLEPITTYDLDVFVELPPADAQSLSPLRSCYAWFRERSLPVDREHVLIEGVPVRILPAFNQLVEEAVRDAISMRFGRVETRVCTAEHLVAILVQTGRMKDRLRLAAFLEQGELNYERLMAILERHGLVERWSQFREARD